MKSPRFGNINNYGVFNSGTVHGDVVQRIDSAIGEGSEKADGLAELRERLVELTALIRAHADDLEAPDQDLNRLGSMAEELGNEEPDRSIVTRYLDLLGESLARIPPIMSTFGAIKELVAELM